MTTHLPIPLNALRALYAVARTGALSPAAEVLGVSVGAVSQHIKKVEARTGRTLFERRPRGLVPTPDLVSALPRLEAGFEALGAASAALMAGEGKVINVTLGTVTASRWLIWRLSRFYAAHPELEVRLHPTGKLVDLTRPDVDCGIRFGPGDWPNADALALAGTEIFPVCTPDLAARLETPADLARVPVIADTTTMLSWPDWLAAAGVPGLALGGPTYTDAALAFDAAISGEGVLLAVEMMAEQALAGGQLVRPFPVAAPSPNGYWLVTARGQELPVRVRKFRDWLMAEMAGT